MRLSLEVIEFRRLNWQLNNRKMLQCNFIQLMPFFQLKSFDNDRKTQLFMIESSMGYNLQFTLSSSIERKKFTFFTTRFCS